jgi:hypothetical protein
MVREGRHDEGTAERQHPAHGTHSALKSVVPSRRSSARPRAKTTPADLRLRPIRAAARPSPGHRKTAAWPLRRRPRPGHRKAGKFLGRRGNNLRANKVEPNRLKSFANG